MNSMAPGRPNPYPYETPDEPRNLTEDDLRFLSLYTGEKDCAELQQHVLDIWRSVKAKMWVYACIQRMMFLEPRITKHSFYPHMLDTLKSDPSLLFLDIGCCFGQDTRQLILDCVPATSITATDITPDYWDFGKKLFMDEGTLAVRTAFGSFADPAFTARSPPGPLGHLSGQVAFAWAGAVLHVLCADDVRAMALHVHDILAPGGVWFGTCVGSDPPGEWVDAPGGRGKRYLHSPSSLQTLLQSVGFSQAEVEGVLLESDPVMAAPLAGDTAQKVMLAFTAKK